MKIPFKRNGKVSVDTLVASAVSRAKSFSYTVPKTPEAISPSGASFKIDTLLPIGIPTGDSRKFTVNSITSRNLPIPLLWQFKTGSGHEQSVIIGRVDSLDITPEGAKNVRGVFDVNPYAREAERMIRAGFLRGVSADLDKFSATEEPGESTLSQGKKHKQIKNKAITIDEARIMGVTVVAMPAFQEAIIEIENPSHTAPEFEDGEYADGILEKETMYGLVASAAPLNPPREWFQKPNTTSPTPITVDDNGRVHGYLALWRSDHIGYSRGQRPPRSSSNYQYFRSGVVRTDDGTDVTVGNLTLVGGHASLNASAQEAVKHYDDTKSAVADVVAGEDQFGIWVAGALRPDVSPNQVRAMRASGVSGDWRPINGKLELVAACFVNVPGFPTPRAMVSSGQITALVAAGTYDLELMRSETTQDKDALALKDALTSDSDLEEQARLAYSIMFPEDDDLDAKAELAFSIMFEDELDDMYQQALSIMQSEDN